MSIFSMFVLSVAAITTHNATLTGKIQDESGAPIRGAIVDIYTAKPRVGAATTCPSCYRDCAKSTTTDDNGRFSIDGLDAGLLFRVLVMAPAQRSQLTKLIDPQTTELDVKLAPIPKDLPHDRMLTGRVLDDQGKPLAGVVVTPKGAKTIEKRWWGQTPGVDEASVTDAEGRFVITSQEPKLGLDLRVTAPGFAKFAGQLFELDGKACEIRMERGASVVGKLTYNGQPVANRSVGIVQRDRSTQVFVGERVIATDRSGNFQFTDLQPNQKYVLYTLCEANQALANQALANKNVLLQNPTTLETHSLTTPSSGGMTQLGELQLVPGITLTGRVTFPAGSKSPNKVIVHLSRDPAWDWCEATLPESGEFQFHGLPSEVYSVIVNAPGFEIDSSKLRYQTTGPSEFGFRLRRDSKTGASITIPMRSK